MITKEYRLEDYIIAEHNRSMYTWEANIVLGEHHTGNCFIVGEILIIHSSAHTKNGCLKLEYGEKLARLPFWSKTDYYCFSDSLKDVKTGRTLSNCLNQTTVKKYVQGAKKPLEKGEYHLGQYKIIVNSKQDIFWEKYDGLNKINKGLCVIESRILFFQSKFSSNDSIKSRREWFRKLRSLPKWEASSAWGLLKILKTCNKKKIKIPQLTSPDYLTLRPVNPNPHLSQHTEKRGRFFKLLNYILDSAEQSGRYLVGKKTLLVRVIPRAKDVSYSIAKFISIFLKKTVYFIRELIAYI